MPVSNRCSLDSHSHAVGIPTSFDLHQGAVSDAGSRATQGLSTFSTDPEDSTLSTSDERLAEFHRRLVEAGDTRYGNKHVRLL